MASALININHLNLMFQFYNLYKLILKIEKYLILL